MDKSDIDIMSAVRASDYDAFKELYRRYSDLVYRNILVRVNSSFDADDIFQDFFVKLWERRADIEINSNVRGYLLVWLKHHILNTIRENQVRIKYDELSGGAFRESDDDYEWVKLASKDMLEQVKRVVDRFPPGLRTVYILRREQHMSVKEIAEKLSVSEQTVKNQITETTRRLNKAVNRKNFILPIVPPASRNCPLNKEDDYGL